MGMFIIESPHIERLFDTLGPTSLFKTVMNILFGFLCLFLNNWLIANTCTNYMYI